MTRQFTLTINGTDILVETDVTEFRNTSKTDDVISYECEFTVIDPLFREYVDTVELPSLEGFAEYKRCWS